MRVRQAHCGPYECGIQIISVGQTRVREYVPATIHKKVYNYILSKIMPILECDVNSPFDVCSAQ
jgi:hypothetical protein